MVKRIIICAVVALFSIIMGISAITDTASSEFVANTPAIPIMHESPLSITKEFSCTTGGDSYIFSGSIYNSSNEDITIQTLRFTYSYGIHRTRTDGYTNLIVPAYGTLDFYQEEHLIWYDGAYKEEYDYVEIKIDGEKQYLMHSNYEEIKSEYDAAVAEEYNKYENLKNGSIVMGGIFSIVALGAIGFGIFFYIKRDEY